MLVASHQEVKNIHHFRKVRFWNNFRFINEAVYSITKHDTFKSELVLLGSFVWATTQKCALFRHLFVPIAPIAPIALIAPIAYIHLY